MNIHYNVSFRDIMGKKCSFCKNASWNSGISIFLLKDETKLKLGLDKTRWDLYTHCCENHYSESDIVKVGVRKSLKPGSVPLMFEDPIHSTEHAYGLHPEVLVPFLSCPCPTFPSHCPLKTSVLPFLPSDQSYLCVIPTSKVSL